MTDNEFKNRVTRICQLLGCSRDLATDYVKAMGDSPVVEHGKVLIRDAQGRIIARVSDSILGE